MFNKDFNKGILFIISFIEDDDKVSAYVIPFEGKRGVISSDGEEIVILASYEDETLTFGIELNFSKSQEPYPTFQGKKFYNITAIVNKSLLE